MVMGKDEAVYFYSSEERGPCYGFDGVKHHLNWFRSYLIIVSEGQQKGKRHERERERERVSEDAGKVLFNVGYSVRVSMHTHALIILSPRFSATYTMTPVAPPPFHSLSPAFQVSSV